MHENKLWKLRLQLFAEGGAEGGEGAVAEPAGGEGATSQTGVAGQEMTFEQLLKSNPAYREAHGAAIKKAVDGRFKSARKAEEALGKMSPMLELLGGKYGVKPGEDGSYDVEALSRAIEADDSYFEEEAAERGLTVQALREQKKLERENRAFRQEKERNLEEERRRSFFDGLYQQAAKLQETVPDFDLKEALKNDQFCRLVNVGVPVNAAFYALNHEKLMSGAMQTATQQAMEAASKSVQAGARRPKENGTGNAAAVDTQAANILDKAYRDNLKRQVNAGKIVIL